VEERTVGGDRLEFGEYCVLAVFLFYVSVAKKKGNKHADQEECTGEDVNWAGSFHDESGPDGFRFAGFFGREIEALDLAAVEEGFIAGDDTGV